MKCTGYAGVSLLGESFAGQFKHWCRTRHDDRLLLSTGNRRRRNGSWSGGAGFFVSKTANLCPTLGPRVQIFNTTNNTVEFDSALCWAGNHYTGDNPSVLAAMSYPSYESRRAATLPLGATLWRRARPGNPTASAFTAAGELLKDGLPSVPGRLLSRLRTIRSVGKEYLNWQFGWAPLVQDIQKMHQTYERLNRQLAQLRRNNGRGIRRHRELEPIVTTTLEQNIRGPGMLNIAPTFTSYGGGGTYHYTSRRETLRRVWLVGRFRYYVPDIGSDQWTRRATRALYGANPTPEALWNLLPWSWLVDWFTKVGDVLSNFSANAVHHSYADYCYVMSHESSTLTNTVQHSGLNEHRGGGRYMPRVPGFTVSSVVKTETKLRLIASPLGFGVTYDGLSPYQMSILGAIGITRSAFR